MRGTLIVLIALIALLQFRLWFGEQGIAQTLHMHHQISLQTQTNMQLQARNDQLAANIQHLKHDPAAIEAIAREDLGMIKRNETYYQFVD